MSQDEIKQIKIDDAGRLLIIPSAKEFSQIYRSAMEVHWDNKSNFLYSPSPREKGWRYLEWFKQILKAVKEEYGCLLFIGRNTEWINIPSEIKEQIIQENHG